MNKPFGLEMFGDRQHSLEKYLPKLAERVGAEELHQVHRLDKTTSGAVILVSPVDEMLDWDLENSGDFQAKVHKVQLTVLTQERIVN